MQFMYLTPKPPPLPTHPSSIPVLPPLLSANIFCIILHLWFHPASAGEATRGYLHGGLLMDFIGQAGPSSKIHLVLLDLLVLALQLTHMSAYMLKNRLKENATSNVQATTSTQSAPASRQDIDAEERGVIRSDEQQDIEMESLSATGMAIEPEPASNQDAEDASERDALLNPVAPRTDVHIFDAFHSGQIVIADLDLRKSINGQVQLVKEFRTDPEAPGGMSSLRSELASRFLRMRMGADALRQTV